MNTCARCKENIDWQGEGGHTLSDNRVLCPMCLYLTKKGGKK
jgi:hypothetical protein